MVLAFEIRKDRTPVVLRKLAKQVGDVRIAPNSVASAVPMPSEP